MATPKKKTNASRPAKRSPANGRSRKDADTLLMADHRKVEGLFKKFEAARTDATKKALAREICTELTVHTMIEEEIFYPGVKPEVEEDMLAEAYVEHDGAKVLIAELIAGTPDDDFYDAKVKVLSEEITHHVGEEEEADGLFAQARKNEDLDLNEMASRLKARSDELMGEMQ